MPTPKCRPMDGKADSQTDNIAADNNTPLTKFWLMGKIHCSSYTDQRHITDPPAGVTPVLLILRVIKVPLPLARRGGHQILITNPLFVS